MNWKDGEDVIVLPSVRDADVEANYPGKVNNKPCLRTVPQSQ